MESAGKEIIHFQYLPEAIDFGFCPVDETAVRSIRLDNKTPEPLTFQIECKSFKVTPEKGSINPRRYENLKISFTPKQAEVLVSTIVIRLSNGEDQVIKVSGIGKYPFLTISNEKVNFESLMVGKRKVKEIILKNQSPVPAKFNITKVENDDYNDNSIFLESYEGEIPAKASFLIRIFYSPTIVNLISVTQFQITCNGGNILEFEANGIALGVPVFLSNSCVNFGEIKIGNNVSRLVTLHNEGDLPVIFEFLTDKGTTFHFNVRKGSILAKGIQRIIITFNPNSTNNYYSRVFCVIRNHLLLYVDMIGTCYDLLLKPLPLLQKHVELFRKRVIEGKLSKLDFKYLESSFLNLKDTSILMHETQENPQIDQEMSKPESYQDDMPISQLPFHKELFLELKSEKRLISLSEELIDFGFCDSMKKSPPREIILQNRLPIKMNILWTNPIDPETGSQLFIVVPTEGVIEPHSFSRFEIFFKPFKKATYFSQLIEFFAFAHISSRIEEKLNEAKKIVFSQTNKDFKNLKKNFPFSSEEMVPPLQSCVRVVGHSFPPNSQPFVPIVQLFPNNNVKFAPCRVGETIYQTLELKNKADTPTYFRFAPDISKIFRIYPSSGMVEGLSFSIILFEFTPKEAKSYNQNISCSLNHGFGSTLHVNLYGLACEPHLKLENEGKLFFPPAYLGVYSKMNMKLKNLSRIPISLSVEIPTENGDVVQIEPKCLKMKPCETRLLDVIFVPYKKKQYNIKIPLRISEIFDPMQDLVGYFNPGSANDPGFTNLNEKSYTLAIQGAGSDGRLFMNPKSLDFGIVKVNFHKRFFFKLENLSNCLFYISFNIKQKEGRHNKYDSKIQNIIEKSFILDFKEGLIAANSKVEIGIMFNPIDVCNFDLVLECIAQERNIKGTFSKSTENLIKIKSSIQILGVGSYPLLKVVDVRNDSVSVASLWENFSILDINKELGSELNEDEKKFLNIEKLPFKEASSLMKRLKKYDWRFGYLPIKPNMKPRKIVVTIQNIGGTELDWNFKLPSDSQINVEPWADPGEPTEEEAKEKEIIERKIFEIKPKSGHLEPGDLCDIELIYSPGTDDEVSNENRKSEKHALQVILQIMNGKPLLLSFKGMTLAPMEGLIAFRKHHYNLPSVPIGALWPVTFPIEMMNVGSTTTSYKAEIIEQGNEKSPAEQKFKIFDIQNPSASMNSGEKAYLYCQFRPLEAKNYRFEIEVQIFDIFKALETIKLTIEGSGFYKKEDNNKDSEVEEIPRQRSLVSPIGSKVFFSIEEVDFGELEPGKAEHRLIILYNMSDKNRLSFLFKQTGLICGDALILDPLKGDLDPGQFMEIKLSLVSNIIPSVYQGELECIIQWENFENKCMEYKQ